MKSSLAAQFVQRLFRQYINRIFFIYVSCIKPKFIQRICMFTGLIMLAQCTHANLLSVNCWNLEICLIAVRGITKCQRQWREQVGVQQLRV